MSACGRYNGPTEVDSLSLYRTGIAQPELPVFCQDWWLNVLRGGRDYHEIKVSSGSEIVGRLPFVMSKGRFGLVRGHDPYWSHLGGPTLDPKMDRNRQAEVIRNLLDQLPRRVSLTFVCDPTVSYADLVRNAFVDVGFMHSTQVTYLRFPAEKDVLSTRKSKHRGHFKRAAKNLDCVEIQAAEFVRFFATNLSARGKSSYAPLEILASLLQDAIARGNGRAIAARPHSAGVSQGDCLPLSYPYDAAVAYIWDANRCYYWLSTSRAADDSRPKPNPDAIKLLALRVMEHAQAMGLVFDADGVATPGADHLYRDIFGLRIEQRRDIFERINVLDRLYEKCRHKFKTIANHQLAVPPEQSQKIIANKQE
jgi:hypothetical protein